LAGALFLVFEEEELDPEKPFPCWKEFDRMSSPVEGAKLPLLPDEAKLPLLPFEAKFPLLPDTGDEKLPELPKLEEPKSDAG